jgi:hypothetical protein
MKRNPVGPMSVAKAVELSIGSTRSKHLVTISDATATVRVLAPHCEHTERELADTIALLAVRSGCYVLFDARQGTDTWPLDENRFAEWPQKTL